MSDADRQRGRGVTFTLSRPQARRLIKYAAEQAAAETSLVEARVWSCIARTMRKALGDARAKDAAAKCNGRCPGVYPSAQAARMHVQPCPMAISREG